MKQYKNILNINNNISTNIKVYDKLTFYKYIDNACFLISVNDVQILTVTRLFIS